MNFESYARKAKEVIDEYQGTSLGNVIIALVVPAVYCVSESAKH